MLPTNNLSQFAKYKVITTSRQLDCAKLIATRVVIDERLPIRWDAEVTYQQPTFFTVPILETKTSLSTSQLVKKAREAGFGDWYPVPEKLETIFIDAVGSEDKVKLVPKYPEPDTTNYLVD